MACRNIGKERRRSSQMHLQRLRLKRGKPDKWQTRLKTILLDKKSISMKTLKQKQILHQPVGALYRDFKVKHPIMKIGASTFHKLRPRYIVPARFTKSLDCLCEHCANINLKVKTLNMSAQCVSERQCKPANAFEVGKTQAGCEDTSWHQSCLQHQMHRSRGCSNRKPELFLSSRFLCH